MKSRTLYFFWSLGLIMLLAIFLTHSIEVFNKFGYNHVTFLFSFSMLLYNILLYVLIFLRNLFPISRYIVISLKTISILINVCFFSCDKYSENIDKLIDSINWLTFIPDIILVCFPDVVFEIICYLFHSITNFYENLEKSATDSNYKNLPSQNLNKIDNNKIDEPADILINKSNLKNKDPVSNKSGDEELQKISLLLLANKKAEKLKNQLKGNNNYSRNDYKIKKRR